MISVDAAVISFQIVFLFGSGLAGGVGRLASCELSYFQMAPGYSTVTRSFAEKSTAKSKLASKTPT